MTDRVSAFVGLGSNVPERRERFREALAALEAGDERIAAVSLPVEGAYELEPGRPTDRHPPVLNAVVELRTDRSADALLLRLHEIEDAAGRVRGRGPIRTLDLDLLAWGDRTSGGSTSLPHPRALERAFVLQPWETIAPLFVVPGTGRTVVEHAARLRARRPEAFRRLETGEAIALPARPGEVQRLENREALDAWRRAGSGTVGVVPTMGALHPGHASLLRRARAECDRVVATLFVNPLQFGEGEDLDRYPRTLIRDLEVLAAAGTDAVYLPDAETLYPDGFATRVVPEGPALGFEGARRPGHFTGVATVVLKLWLQTRPDRTYFGQKDAQQLAVMRRMVRDLDLSGRVVGAATVHAPDGLALSSRNRYLGPDGRETALALPRALESLAFAAATATAPIEALTAEARRGLESVGLAVDYLEVVDPQTFEPTPLGEDPALAVATVRVGDTRLLDNRWVAKGDRP